MFFRGQHARDDASVQSAAERTVQLAATLRLLRRMQNLQHVFGTDSEAIMLRSLEDECVQFALVVQSFAYS